MKYLRTPKDGETVSIYWNLHRKCFSVLDADGHVIEHANNVLLQEAEFIVREAGRQRVLREKRKNVHAFVRGRYVSRWRPSITRNTTVDMPGDLAIEMHGIASYNPYRGPEFTVWGQPTKSAAWAWARKEEAGPRIFVPAP